MNYAVAALASKTAAHIVEPLEIDASTSAHTPVAAAAGIPAGCPDSDNETTVAVGGVSSGLLPLMTEAANDELVDPEQVPA